MQYFIFPLAFENKEGKVIIDFTLRSGFDADSLVTTNFSIYTDEEFTNLKQVTLHHAAGKSELMNIGKLFSEPSGNSIHSRYTSKLYFADFLFLCSNPEAAAISIMKDKEAFIAHATAKTKKKLRQLREQIPILH